MTTIGDVDQSFWQKIDKLVHDSKIVIDRLKGSTHPRDTSFVLPMDYGYLEGTVGGDGEGIDLWKGSKEGLCVDGIICTVDLAKRDAEIKILISCTEEEKRIAYETHNNTHQGGVLIARPAAS